MSEKCVHEWYYRIVDIVSWQFFCIRCGEKLSMDKFSNHASDLEKNADALNARIAELKAYIDQLIEIGSWAITGMTITTSYSPGVLQDLAEKKSDDWCALIKNLEECDKENEREE